jgi:hypothetical protein
MNCNQMHEDVFLNYAKLSAADRATADAHLAACAGCRTRMEGFRAVSSALDEWETPELSPWFNARLRRRIAEEEALQWSWRRAFDWLRRPATATAFAAVLVLGTTAVWMARPAIPPAPVAPPPVHHADELLPVVEDFEMLANFDAITELKTKAKKSEL